jgi:phenylalanyl-tRNA synthetase beta chain
VVEQSDARHLPVRAPVVLRADRIRRVLGVEVADEEVSDILERLGMQVEPIEGGWRVTPPSARFDIAIEADLIEEIGRIHGYDNIPASLRSAPVSIEARPEASFSLDRARDTLVDRDFHEAITYSFISPEMAALVTPGQAPIRLANPISADMSVMRASIWPGLLGAAQYNLARQQERVRLFETGLTFERVDGELVQKPHIAALVCGSLTAEQWGVSARKVDFFDLKGDLEAVLGQVADDAEFVFEAAEHAALHPGQSAWVLRQGQPIGWIGALHPRIQQQLGLPATYLFEILVEGLEQGRLPAFQPLSKFPSIRRDLAVVLARDIPYAEVQRVAREAAPPAVQDIQLFDVYTGDNIDSGLKSLALSLILQESSHTLKDQEVEQASQRVLEALAQQFSARLRD